MHSSHTHRYLSALKKKNPSYASGRRKHERASTPTAGLFLIYSRRWQSPSLETFAQDAGSPHPLFSVRDAAQNTIPLRQSGFAFPPCILSVDGWLCRWDGRVAGASCVLTNPWLVGEGREWRVRVGEWGNIEDVCPPSGSHALAMFRAVVCTIHVERSLLSTKRRSPTASLECREYEIFYDAVLNANVINALFLPELLLKNKQKTLQAQRFPFPMSEWLLLIWLAI